ncbi:unnamed protein product [Wuchereria bancrofti]|uniref:SSD domain-containing protein n=1 Tax=Wuchereria bancrofti TaxID=6293 RepID=A0A3P7EFP7_WUCBA|nr:unnamed protein product [Wuchereria bancrofti]
MVVVLLTILTSSKLLFVKPKDNLQSGYTPPNARAFSELEVFRKFNDGKDPVVVIIIVTAKDGGSVTRLSHLNEILNIVDYVGTHFPVKNYTYYQMCRNFCDVNEPVRQFRNGLLLNTAKHFDKNTSRSNTSSNIGRDLIELSFPIMQLFGRDLDLSPYFFGVEYTADGVDRISGTNIKHAKLVALHFRTQRPNEWTSDDTFHWERLVGHYFENEYNNSLIRPIAFSLAYTQDEIIRAGLALMPYILLGFIMMCIFAVGTVSISSTYTRQFSKIKILYALVGCITPLMATSAALGLVILLGLRPGSILCVTPFLTLAIVAIFLDYVYTITLYAAVLCIGGQIETQQKCIYSERKPPEPSMVTTFLHNYCKYLSSGFTTTLIFILLVIYLTASIKYALMAKGCLTPGKLFLADSPMIEVNRLHDKIIMPSYTFVTVFILEPGDLRNSSRRERMKALVSQFEAVPGCKGSRFTHFWLRDYEMYLESKNEEINESGFDDYTSNDLLKFLEWPEYESLGGFMKFDNQTNRLTAFYVTITYHGKNQSDWIQRLNMLKAWRAIVDPVMIAISSTASICVGVFGFLTFWNVDVDPVSMATMIMSIGLSVDFPAHITFHYHRTGSNPDLTTVKERLAHSFSTIGFPLLQCSFSTVFFVLILLLVPSYMSEVFTKAVVVVISLGTFHALIIVPAVLCAFSNIYQYFLFVKDYKLKSFTGIVTTKITDSFIAVQQPSSTFHSTTKSSTH